MSHPLHEVIWPADRPAEAFFELSRAIGWAATGAPTTSTASPEAEIGEAFARGRLDREMTALADAIGLEIEPITSPMVELAGTLKASGPGLLWLPLPDQPGGGGWLAVTGRRGASLRVLTPRGLHERCSLRAAHEAIVEATLRGAIEPLREVLGQAGVAPEQVGTIARVMAEEQKAGDEIRVGWMLRPALGRDMVGNLRRHGVFGHLAQLFATGGARYLAVVGSWWVLGQQALGGQIEAGWMALWALLNLALIPLAALELWVGGQLGVGVGLYLKRRLLLGLLRLDPDEVRSHGSGTWLGRVVESESVEQLILGGGLTAATAAIQLVAGIVVLGMGAGGWGHAATVGVSAVIMTALTLRYGAWLRAWTHARLEATHGLVERLLGYRTRIVQQRPTQWHAREDVELQAYFARSRGMDDGALSLGAVGARAWYIVALLALIPAFAHSGVEELAVSVGGILLTGMALESLVGAAMSLMAFQISWAEIRQLFHAASRRPDVGLLPARAAADRLHGRPSAGDPLVVARNIAFTYPGRREPVLRGCSLELRDGDRRVLTGSSGGGKSTLAQILAGLRVPDSGLLLWRGFDPAAIGEESWRRQVSLVPQFHDNHVLGATLGFNLFLGVEWPPSQEALERAWEICADLGLDEVIAKMPGGFQQTVGETGWQLSHGEQSRLFVARALIQDPDVLILDESFGALDPENMERALDAVEKYGRAVVVIAHP